ncbi:MAG: hypothetical protein IH856_06275 [Deltaproteobacteria bacterium]|nr:hypothetical protein [Deltaproteobacteria bacterium]MCZ6548184.1 hypothetical protein [Deltaproteobacteria bacterium]MCZ6562680.1 hypothetical protein [Deltaproteobacteria bacterium]MCZ6621089.1 hypothetical protein [Deltaproteobacteria bacterium]MCZ6907135.1 hypothetical protein [Deltaproteobacteria bacterium]
MVLEVFLYKLLLFILGDQILDAFLKRNPELAQAATVKHLENQMQVLKTVLDLGDEVKGAASNERK